MLAKERCLYGIIYVIEYNKAKDGGFVVVIGEDRWRQLMYKIAVCDDEIKILEDINRMIKKHQPDAEVSTYSNGERLLKAMEEENYDVVLLDIDMPGMSGIL